MVLYDIMVQNSQISPSFIVVKVEFVKILLHFLGKQKFHKFIYIISQLQFMGIIIFLQNCIKLLENYLFIQNYTQAMCNKSR